MITGRCQCARVQYEVDGDLDCPTGFHQFVASKAPWFKIHDDLPQYDEWPDEDQQDGVI